MVYTKDITASDGGVWRLIQYPDGTVKAYRWFSDILLTDFKQWGNLYETKAVDPVPYPITFSEVPTVRVEQWGGSFTMLAFTFFGEGTRTQTPSVYAVRPDLGGNNHSVFIGIYATGRAPSIR